MKVRILPVLALACVVTAAHAQQQVEMRGNTPVAPRGVTVPPLPDDALVYETGEGMDVRLVVLARGLEFPWSMAFLPQGDVLVVERPGRLRLIRDDALLPEPVRGTPEILAQGLSGLGDLAVHPDFASNGLIYMTYTKPMGERSGLGVARAVWQDDALTRLEDVFVTDEAGGISRLIFGVDGKLYVSAIGGGEGASQDPSVLGGKILRLNDDGSVPDDNPFVGREGHRPEIFTLGHRTPSGLALHRATGDVYQLEMGPNGGDEINRLVAGGNYGWPLVSLGRTYAGPWQAEKWNRDGMIDPVVFWMPSISTSGLDFYTGDRLPAWSGDLFVGGMRYGEIPGTGQLQRILLNENMEELRREVLFADLRQRIRDVREGPDGLLYLLTDASDGAVLRIEPVE